MTEYEQDQLWDQFLEEWPLNKVQSMSLEEYTGFGEQNTFQYWIERKLQSLGDIRGSFATKFGIFKMNPNRIVQEQKPSSTCQINNGYSWLKSFGSEPDEIRAFENVRKAVCDIIAAAQQGEFSKIQNIPLQSMFKWKIAFLYQNRNQAQITPVFSTDMLKYLSGFKDNTNIPQMHLSLLQRKKESENLWEFANNEWKRWSDYQKSRINYWVVNGADAEKIKYCLQNSVFIMQQQYQNENSSTVTKQLKKAIQIQPGDQVLLFNKNRYFAYGTFSEVDFDEVENNNSLANQIENKTQQNFGEKIYYHDAPCYYEDLESTNGFNGKWGQRLQVKEWVGIATDGIEVSGIRASADFTQDTIIKLNNASFFNKVVQMLSKTETNKELNSNSKTLTTENNSLNTILYGPPGTGKTYHTINHALSVIEGIPLADLELEDRTELKRRYDEYVESKQIVFTTFHQSMSYEDFIEGIKPDYDAETNQLQYPVTDGIFKQICKIASTKPIAHEINNLPNWNEVDYFKISLGGKNKPEIHDWCIQNNYLSIGWGGEVDHSQNIQIKEWKSFRNNFIKNHPDLVQESKYHIQAIFTFAKMKKGDVVIATWGNLLVSAVGIVDGDYEFEEYKGIDYCHFRKVKWIATNLEISPDYFLKKKISQQSIYQFYNEDVRTDVFAGYFNQESSTSENKSSTKNHVLIIDEINRGNISKIFGELITLIEPSKRLGAEDQITLTLPYSKESFGVPQNLHILGTMNTADRSIALMDTALRRRFEFVEMMPLHELDELQKEIEGIHLGNLLFVINARIEYLYDRDHTIGHAYFIGIHSKADLDAVMRNKIIPLLQEYFYGDWEKIQIVLGDHYEQLKAGSEATAFDQGINQQRFVQSRMLNETKILGFNHRDIEDHQVNYKVSAEFPIEAYQRLCDSFDNDLTSQD
jgi:5-methylcytosine-specific restriction endonuclease McrBC GTP-binding regulatory subunit McrB